MHPLFQRCAAWLEANQFESVVRSVPELTRTAATPEELVVAARAASVAGRHLLELRLLRRATAVPEAPAAAWNRLAGYYVATGQFLLAEEVLLPRLQAAAWTPAERAWGHLALAGAMAGRRRFLSAAAQRDAARSLAPADDGDLAVQLAYVDAVLDYSQDRWEAAEEQLTALVARAPAEARLYQLLARCREHLHRPADALEALQAGVAALPEHPSLWLATAALAWTLGRRAVAEPATARFQALLDRPRFRRTARLMARIHTGEAVRLHLPPVRQGHNHCFPACIAMVKGYWGRPADHRTVGAAVMQGQAGTPLFQALGYLEAEGWQVRAFRATPERLRQLIDRGVPPILGLEFAGGAHVHICTGYADWGFLLQDPASIHPRGLRHQGFDPIYRHSDYWALAFVPADRAELLAFLPAADDAQIRQMQRCWEALSRSDLEGARQEYAALPWAEPSTGLRLFALRLWPRLTGRTEALAAADALLADHGDDADIVTEVAEHLERLREAERACSLLRALPGRQGAPARMILGRAAPEPEAAVAHFRAAAMADSDNPEPVAEWGRALLQMGRLPEARACFEAAFEMEDRPAYQADLADLIFREGDAAGAVRAFRQVLRRDRVYPWAWWRRGEAHFALGQWRSALRCMALAASQAPDDAHYLDRLALASERSGRAARAAQLLRQSPLLEGSAELQATLAGMLLNRSRQAEALEVAGRAMERFPQDGRFPPMVAEALRRLDRVDEGRQVLAAAVERLPDNPWVRARFGRYLVLTGEIAAGLEQVAQARAEAPDLTDPLEWLARAAGGLGDREAILTYLEGEAEGAPWLWGQLAHLWPLVDRERAMACAEKGLAHEGRIPAALAEFGHVALEADRPDRARAAFEEALAAEPATPRACYGLALLARAAGEHAGEAEWLRSALLAEPDRAEARQYADELAEWYEAHDLPGLGPFLDSIAGRVAEAWRLTYKGYWHELSDQPALALPYFDRAAAHDSALVWPHYRRPLALLAADRPEEALYAARATLSRFPHEPGLPCLEGHALAALGQREAAAAAFGRAADSIPDSDPLRRAEYRVMQASALIDAYKWEESLAAWRQVVADNPRHFGALRRVTDEAVRWGRYSEVLSLLEEPLERRWIPAHEPRVLAHALTAALALRRPLRPHWRSQLRARLYHIWAEGGDSTEWDTLHRLYERVELAFGNLRGARRVRVVRDGLVNWLRTGAMALLLKLRRPPLDVRLGEPTEPSDDPYPATGYRAARGPALYTRSVAFMDRVGDWVRRNLVSYFLLFFVLLIEWSIRSHGGETGGPPLELILWGVAGTCALLPRYLWSVRKVVLDA